MIHTRQILIPLTNNTLQSINDFIYNKILFKSVVIHIKASNDKIHTYSFLEDGICFIMEYEGGFIFFISGSTDKALSISNKVLSSFDGAYIIPA